MPFYHGQLQTVSFTETKRYAGLRQKENFPDRIVEDACMEAQLLAKPKGLYEIFDYDEANETILSPLPLQLTGKSITKHVAGSHKVALLAVTVGETIEEEIRALFAKGSYTAGLLLDAAATAAVESIADQVNEAITSIAAKEGYQTTWRFSPGYGDWDITVQKKLLTTIHAEEIGLAATESFMLMPRKSVTAAIGFLPLTPCSNKTKETERSCHHCPHKNCFARKESTQ